MLLLLSTIATRCDFSALIVNRKNDNPCWGGESRSLGRRESRAFWAITDVGSGKPYGITRAPHPACSEKVGQNVPVVR
jgi:hypothetical protein